MQHMGCEPDRASYNIMVDAYGRAGLHSGNTDRKKQESALHTFMVSGLVDSDFRYLYS